MFQALGHPARLALIQMLVKSPGMTQRDLMTKMPLASSTIREHLQVLRGAGIVFGNDTDIAMPLKVSAASLKMLKRVLNRMIPLESKTDLLPV